MKRVFFVLMFVATTTNISAYEADINGVIYDFHGTTATVRYINKLTNSDPVITIPAVVNYEGINYTVTQIGRSSFRGTNTIYYGVTSATKTVILPNTIKTIEEDAFAGCTSISTIVLQEGLQRIGNRAFSYTKINQLTIPSTVTIIGEGAFNNCDLLRKITYLGPQPLGWVAAEETYIPDNSWDIPSYFYNYYNIYPMIYWSALEFNYNGEYPTTTWENHMNGYTTSLTIPPLHKEAGEWIEYIPVTFTNGDESFDVIVTYKYVVKPAVLIVSTNDYSRLYGDENPTFDISISGFVNGESIVNINVLPIAQTNATKESIPGKYPITFIEGEADNYVFTYENGTLTIDKAQLTINANNANREYGTDNPAFTFTLEGLKNGETQPTWTDYPYLYSDAIPRSTIGTYDININGGISPNYEVTKVKGTLSVTKATLTVQVKNVCRLYGEKNPTFSYSVTGKKFSDDDLGWVDDVTYSTQATNTSDCGEYEVYPEGQISNPNYDLIKKPGKITIQKRDLIVSTPNYKRPYGTDNPTFEMNFDGFVLGDNQDDLTIQPTIKTTASKDSNVGVYPLSLSGGESMNYYFVDQCGTLTIEKAEQTLSWEQEFGSLAKYAQVELQAQASSGLDVKYTIVEGSSFANIYKTGSKSYLDILGKGEIVVMAQQDGNQNYYSTAKIYKTIHAVDNRNLTLTIKDGEKGELIETISHGESRQILIQPYRGHKIHSVTFNNQDVTTKVSSEGLYNTPSITENASLHIVFEATSDAIQDVSSDSLIRILANNGVIVVENLEAGKQIFIYDLDGRKQASAISNGYSTTIRLATDQTYIVKAGTKTVKVRL